MCETEISRYFLGRGHRESKIIKRLPEKSVGIMERSVSSGSGQSARYETFTEAVPLSLSSMAHASLPLEDGVLDGVRQILSHTLLSCVNYARIVHPPHQWTFRDLTTSEFAWTTVKGEEKPPDLPFSLTKLAFKHQYTRNAWIYLKPALPAELTAEEELEKMEDSNWTEQVGILGRVSLLYVSKEPLTTGEMDGTDTEDMPHTVLYKVLVEYRSLPATGNQQAVQAEELSMLSFGGSVDDDVKYGALASLYDEFAQYVLEIYSVRGKKYKFDLMDSTLNDGTVPHLPSKCEGDPFVKCLCATVTDHRSLNDEDAKNNKKYAITRMQLSLQGKPRKSFDELPRFDYMANAIMACFLQLNPEPPLMVSATPSGHTLLLDPSLAGHVYVNGRYVTNWGKDPRIGAQGVALFGMDLHSIPFWHGSIVDYEVMKVAYGQLWQEILVDARLLDYKIASRLLYRLMRGYDFDEDEDDLYDDEDDAYGDTSTDCLESQVLANAKYDRVGIAAKALATCFNVEFGAAAFPCLEHEVEWVKSALPGRKPVVVPYRLIIILRRGGHFDVQRTSDEAWHTDTRPAKNGEEKDTVAAAVNMLEQAGCEDVETEQIVFTATPGTKDPISDNAVCRYNRFSEQFIVHENFIARGVDDLVGDESSGKVLDTAKSRAYLLGMYIAQAHPDGLVIARYLLRTQE